MLLIHGKRGKQDGFAVEMIFSLIFSYFLIASHTHYEDCLKMYFCFCGGHFKQISRLGVVHHEYDFKKL